MIKINLLPKTHRIAGRTQAVPPRPRTDSIQISQQSINAWANNFFGLNNPLMFFAAPASPGSDLLALKNKILDTLRAKERYAEESLQVFEKSFDLMIRFHKGETLPNGERVAIHLLGIARTLCEWGSDPLVASAGMLHLIPLSRLKDEGINQDVFNLIQKKTALEKFLFIPLGKEKLSERHTQYLYKMCLMLEGDRSVWLLEAAVELQSLSSSKEIEERTELLASRAYNVTSPLLSLFDLDDIAVDLENIAFMRLDEGTFKKYEAKITEVNKRDRMKALDHLRTLTALITEELDAAKIKHRVIYSVKSVTRAMKKISKGEILTDASRFRYIIDGPPAQCKKAMEIIRSDMEELGYTEDESEKRNYISGISIGTKYDKGPKTNGYESLHMHFRGESFEPLNVQIRTEKMHLIAELGSASHGRFKLNGLIEDVAMDEASVVRKNLIGSGLRYGKYGNNLYRLVPYPSNKNIRIIDLLFAISPEHGLHAPAEVTVERIDPQTGNEFRKKAPISSRLENGDLILPFKKTRKPSLPRIRPNQLSSLPSLITYRLARGEELDPNRKEERSSSAAAKGKAALSIEVSSWRSEFRDRLISILRKEGEDPEALKIDTLFSLERAGQIMGLRTETGIYLALGLTSRRKKIIERVMNIIRTSSTAIAYKILADTSYADLWLVVADVPGALLTTLHLFQNQGFSLVKFSNQRLSRGYSLMKARVKVRKKSIEEDLLAFLSTAKRLYESTREAPTGIKTTQVNIYDLRLQRLNLNKISRIAEVFQKAGANIIKSDFSAVLEGKAVCSILAEVPALTVERLKSRLRGEFQRLGIKGYKIT